MTITGPDDAGEPAEPRFAGLAGRNWLNHVLPQATVTVWPASGHFPHLADPRRFAGCLAATARWCRLARPLPPHPSRNQVAGI